ncbi:hypothetical protein BGZ88_008376 [Linnemannia elongata]|nr:hypothetical protein BGZ88_008376 [Linnemannia elongata]
MEHDDDTTTTWRYNTSKFQDGTVSSEFFQLKVVLTTVSSRISSSDQALHLMQGLALSDDGNDGGDNDDNDDNDGYETDGDDMAGNQTNALVDFLDSVSDM